MKLPVLLAAGALAAGTFAAVPAEAQRYGYHRYTGGGTYRGYHHRYWGSHHGYGYGYRGGYGYGYRGHYGRPRVSCRIVRGYYGPERRCFRAY